ncbi:MAG: hypothetical protein HY815_18630 [Candidatus Riflebacteria bacterium]|nr:hypothetical protein [Candidatus Riflebacteria bacterium]
MKLSLRDAFVVALTALSLTSVSPARPVGQLVSVTRDAVMGWAFDPEDPRRTVAVQLRILEGSRVVRILTGQASTPQPTRDQLFVGQGGHWFRFSLEPLPASAELTVELQLEAGAAGPWYPEVVATVPSPEEASLGALTLTGLHLETQGSSLVVAARLLSGPAKLDRIAFAIEVGGEDGPWTTDVIPLEPGALCLKARVDLARYPALESGHRSTGQVLVSVVASDRALPERFRIVGAARLAASDNTPSWAEEPRDAAPTGQTVDTGTDGARGNGADGGAPFDPMLRQLPGARSIEGAGGAAGPAGGSR